MELDVGLAGFEHIADTINYEGIATRAQTVAAEGHFPLVEGFAERLGQAYLEDPRVAGCGCGLKSPRPWPRTPPPPGRRSPSSAPDPALARRAKRAPALP